MKSVEKSTDIAHADSVWPHRSPNSLAMLTQMAEFNPNAGAFKDDDTFVAWVFR